MLFCLGLTQALPAFAKDAIFTATFSNTAVKGYDAVAYFTEGRAVKGTDDFELQWKGVDWNFSNAENLAAFKANPERFAPQYGGYCAWAVSQGYTASTDPKAWSIVEGKLYLNYSKNVQNTWAQNIPVNIAKADGNWPGVLGE
ncbi:YHS domain-containing (seleno)protein [Magnetovibrio sp. PR-2]|uniref:YHS domain-containing (seleno)protein n=1 Tax=Magnetovibrio sp. PR-2 TaxID=3120356 RepID=UPI002FCE1D29